MAASMPMLYKIASQNMDTRGNPDLLHDAGLTFAANPGQEARLRDTLRSCLGELDDTRLARLKGAMLDNWLETEINLGEHNLSPDLTERVATLENMDAAYADPKEFVAYVTATKEFDRSLAPDKSTAQYYEGLSNLHVVTRLSRWIEEAGITPSDKLTDTLIDLELLLRTYTLNPDFFDGELSADGQTFKVRLKPAPDQHPERAKERLFREDITVFDEAEMKQVPADLALPESKTVRCSAMSATLSAPQTVALSGLARELNFSPKTMNGLDFVTLASLWATRTQRKTINVS